MRGRTAHTLGGVRTSAHLAEGIRSDHSKRACGQQRTEGLKWGLVLDMSRSRALSVTETPARGIQMPSDLLGSCTALPGPRAAESQSYRRRRRSLAVPFCGEQTALPHSICRLSVGHEDRSSLLDRLLDDESPTLSKAEFQPQAAGEKRQFQAAPKRPRTSLD